LIKMKIEKMMEWVGERCDVDESLALSYWRTNKANRKGKQYCNILLFNNIRRALTLSPPAVKTQCLSQCQAFQRFVRSSHTLVNWILNNFWSTESILNQFSVFLKTSNALCVCLQYKHPRSVKSVIRTDKPITLVFPVKSQKNATLALSLDVN
jgi:hypothetical protein